MVATEVVKVIGDRWGFTKPSPTWHGVDRFERNWPSDPGNVHAGTCPVYITVCGRALRSSVSATSLRERVAVDKAHAHACKSCVKKGAWG